MSTYVLLVASIVTASVVACAGKTDNAATPSGSAAVPSSTTAGAPAPAVARSQSGSEAAARLTPADLEDRMKKIGTTANSMRMHLTEKQLPDVAKEAQDLAMWFGDVEKFWTQNARPDAVMWAQQARQAATQAAGAAAAGDGMKAQTAASTLLGACRMCHDAYREADGNGGFRLKAGIVR